MPAGFNSCVSRGGRVRRVSGPSKEHGLEANEYVNYCYIGGKSYRGETKVKEVAKDGESIMAKKKKVEEFESFVEDLSFSFKEIKIDEDNRTVRVCALAPCVSKNNRYYSPSVIEKASGTLFGKKCFADHDQRDTKNLIGRIVDEEYKDGKLYANIKISKAKGVSRETWEKVQDGTITDVSIAADGKSKRVKLGDKIVHEVTELDIKSVDFVPTGGVEAAKVQQVFENIKDIPTISEVKKKMENLEQLKNEYPTLVEELIAELSTAHKQEVKTLKAENETVSNELNTMKMDAFKAATIAKLETTAEIKALLIEKVSGKTEAEITASIDVEHKFIEKIQNTNEKEAKIEGVAEGKKADPEIKLTAWSTARIREDKRIAEEHKVICCEILIEEGSDKMKAYMKSKGVEL